MPSYRAVNPWEMKPPGALHLLLSVVFETPVIIAACIVLARRFAQAHGGRPWVLYSIATIILLVAYLSNDPASLFGLLQRLEFFTGQGWIAVLAVRLLAGGRPEPPAQEG